MNGMIAYQSCRQTRNWLIVLLWRFRYTGYGGRTGGAR